MSQAQPKDNFWGPQKTPPKQTNGGLQTKCIQNWRHIELNRSTRLAFQNLSSRPESLLTFSKSFSKPDLSRRSSWWSSTLVSRNFSILTMLSAPPSSPVLQSDKGTVRGTGQRLSPVCRVTFRSVAEVVHHHRTVTGFNQLHHAVAADVAGPACDQHLLCHSQNLRKKCTRAHGQQLFYGKKPVWQMRLNEFRVCLMEAECRNHSHCWPNWNCVIVKLLAVIWGQKNNNTIVIQWWHRNADEMQQILF